METISTQPEFDTVEPFIKAVKVWAKGSPRWGVYIGRIAGRTARIKTYGRSYPQILESNGIRYGGLGDMKPTAFDAELRRAFPTSEGNHQ